MTLEQIANDLPRMLVIADTLGNGRLIHDAKNCVYTIRGMINLLGKYDEHEQRERWEEIARERYVKFNQIAAQQRV